MTADPAASSLSRRQVLALAASAAVAAAVPRASFGQQAPQTAPAHKKAAVAAEERKAFFDAGKVPALALEVGKKEMDDLRRDPRKYVVAQLKEDGGKATYKDVAVHLKGAAGSFRGVDDKPGLTLNVDKFTDNQLFHGMEKFHLNNSAQDPGYLSELFVGELYRAAGVPASKLTHAAVTLNGRRLGLYALKEGYDKGFLKSHFDSANGNFYDGGFLRDIDQPLELNGGKDDVKDHADLKALVAAANDPDRTKRWPQFEKLLDMDRFISYLCLQTFTWDWDGYPMNRNNYRIYHDPKPNKLVFIPSGMDQMFADLNGPLLPGYQGMLASKVMRLPEGRARYLARMGVLLKDVLVVEKMTARLNELRDRVQPAIKPFDEGVARDLPNHVNRLKDAVTRRHRKLSEELKNTKA